MNVTEQTYNAIWQEMLDVARLERYYARLRDRYLVKHQISRSILLIFAGVGVSAVVSHLISGTSEWEIIAGLASATVIAVCVVVDFASQSSRKLGILQAIATEINHISGELTHLWDSILNLPESEVVEEKYKLEKRLTQVTSWAGLADIKVNNKLNVECAQDAYQFMEEKYSA